MGSLLTSMLNTANAMKVLENGLTVTENNVVNADTPGYAAQSATFDASPFDLSQGLTGGVTAGIVQSSRNQYAEQAVRDQQSNLGLSQQKVTDLTAVQNYFSLSTTSGLAPAMDALFSSFSQLSVTPNDTESRQDVLNKAADVAQQFQDTANGLENQQADIATQTGSTITNINQLAATIAQINGDDRVDYTGQINAGLDAQLNSSLEQLSQYVNFTTLQMPDGTVTVLIGGQTPLVVGNQAYDISGNLSNQQTSVYSSTGTDITGQITGGQLSALLDDYNNVIPGYVNSLNTLAQSFADTVNNTLDNGIDQNGAAPTTDLFGYNAAEGAAQTLAVNSLTPDQIAAALPAAPGGNGNALALAQLASTPAVNGYTFDQYYGSIGQQVGGDLSDAQADQSTDESLLNQAQSFRQQVSGVSLDTEAENLMQYQQSYDAVTKMLTVLNDMTETLMNVILPS